MEITEKNFLQLRHYCTSIEEALRPILQTKNYSGVDPEYWINSLTRFRDLIEKIIGSDSDKYKDLYLKHFQILLTATTDLKTRLDTKYLFDTAKIITDEVYSKLYEAAE